jgi:hypothetical protein
MVKMCVRAAEWLAEHRTVLKCGEAGQCGVAYSARPVPALNYISTHATAPDHALCHHGNFSASVVDPVDIYMFLSACIVSF